MEATYKIPAENLAEFTARVEKLNKKAAKCGASPVTVTLGATETVSVTSEGGAERKRTFRVVTMTGESPKFAGWAFLGTIYHTTEGNMLLSVPGSAIPAEYRTVPSKCDHCRTARRRNDTYVVRHDDGRTMQVGHSCLRDFLGHADPHRLATWAEILGAFEREMESSEGGWGTRVEYTVELAEWFAIVAAQIRLHGWMSAATAREHSTESRSLTPTSQLAWSWAFPTWSSMSDSSRAAHKAETPTDADRAIAEQTLAWAQTEYAMREDLNDYAFNCAVVTKASFVNYRTRGIAASIVSGYLRAMERAAELKLAKETSTSTHVGTVGERMRDIKVTLTKTRALAPSDFGSRVMLQLQDEAGNVFVWFTGGESAPEILLDAAGQPRAVFMDATVKQHGEFGGVKQTTVSRASFGLNARPVKVKKTKKGAA